MSVVGKTLVAVGIILGAIIVFVAVFFGVLTIIEYKPKPVEELTYPKSDKLIERNVPIKMLSWNIGYAGLGASEDFFMDGGKKVRPDSKQVVEEYLAGICSTIIVDPVDIYNIQEVDIDSKRSFGINEAEEISKAAKMPYTFAYNYCCQYVPFPLPTIGKVKSGVATYTNYSVKSAQRVSLPVSFKWPVRIANLKRCLLVTRLNVKDSDKEVVLVNFHLEAFSSDKEKAAQTKVLMAFILAEYEKGNYIIVGGDFNQTFPVVDKTKYPKVWTGWQPGELEPDMLPEGWNYAVDDSYPTCRSNERPYIGEDAESQAWQYHVIDGFIISPNVKKLEVQVIDEDFIHSDHNPVFFSFELK